MLSEPALRKCLVHDAHFHRVPVRLLALGRLDDPQGEPWGNGVIGSEVRRSRVRALGQGDSTLLRDLFRNLLLLRSRRCRLVTPPA